jgi:hypothetical protein
MRSPRFRLEYNFSDEAESFQDVLPMTEKKNQNQIYVERRDEGDYAVRRGGAARASAVESTQREAIEAARKLAPSAPIHVERVRNTDVGRRDKWRKP